MATEKEMANDKKVVIAALRELRNWLENDKPGFGMDEIQDLWVVVYALEARIGLVTVQSKATIGRLNSEDSIGRIREILEDDVNYQNTDLVLGGIWDVCDRFADYVRLDNGRMVEVKPREKAWIPGA